MGIEYVDDCEFDEVEDFEIDQDSESVGSLTRVFEGRTDKLAQWLSQWRPDTHDATFPQFKFQKYRASRRGAFTLVTVEMRGMFADEITDIKPRSGWRRHNSTLHQLGGSGVADVEYAAPFTTYRYITREKPTKQRFAGQLELLDAAWEIYQVKGAREVQFFEVQPLGRIGGVVSGGRSVTGKYNWVREVTTAIFTPEPVGDYWDVTEQNEGRMLGVERTDLPRFLFPNRISGG